MQKISAKAVLGVPTTTALIERLDVDKSLRGVVTAPGVRRAAGAFGGFPPEVIHQAIWLYLRFTLSFRDVEDLLAERGIIVSYETVRRWVNHFGPIVAADLRKRRPKPHSTWHLDEVYLKIGGRVVYLWRAVDGEGEVLDVLVQSKRDKHAALKLNAQASEEVRLRPRTIGHGRLAIIRLCGARART